MDTTFFSVKRAYHGTLRVGRKRLRDLGLTAARFDLLFALTNEGRTRGAAFYQSALRRLLGVTRPTVSRMLRSLEELGLVRRRRSQIDRRQVEVQLTSRGWIRIRVAYRRMTLSGWAMFAIAAAMSGMTAGESPWLEVDLGQFENTEILEGFLAKLRQGFGDFASLVYPWCPDDDWTPDYECDVPAGPNHGVASTGRRRNPDRERGALGTSFGSLLDLDEPV